MGYDIDSKLEWQFEKTGKGILGTYFFTKDIKKDQNEGQDFAIYRVPSKTGIAVRWRRHLVQRNGYLINQLKLYGHQFTIRWLRPSGVLTEIHKIRRADVDYILYGFIDEGKTKILQYFIGDLKIFRQNEPWPVEVKENHSKDSTLAVYNISQFPKTFILKEWKNAHHT